MQEVRLKSNPGLLWQKRLSSTIRTFSAANRTYI